MRYPGVPNDKVLSSVFKFVPPHLRKQMMKYATKGKRDYRITWHARQPLPGKKYGWGGALKLGDGKTADMYVQMTDDHCINRFRQRYWFEESKKQEIIDDLEEKFNTLFGEHKWLQEKLATKESALSADKHSLYQLRLAVELCKSELKDGIAKRMLQIISDVVDRISHG